MGTVEQLKVKPNFAVGTVVYLKSGGPPMTVTKFPPEGFVKKGIDDIDVEWFDGSSLYRDSFLFGSLTTKDSNRESFSRIATRVRKAEKELMAYLDGNFALPSGGDAA